MRLKNNIIATLEIGTTKVTCLIASINSSGDAKIIGIGHHAAKGLKSGVITDMKLAENSILSAIDEAEKMCGLHIDIINVCLPPHNIESTIISSSIKVSGQILDKNIKVLINQTLGYYNNVENNIIHYFPLEYSIDNSGGIQNPRLMYGETLSVKMHILSASANNIANIINCISRCHLDIDSFIISSYAAGISALSDDETSSGVILVDIGATSSSYSIFYEGNLLEMKYINIGSAHITSDIKAVFNIDFNTAERIKTLYGSVIESPLDSKKTIEIQRGEEEGSYGNFVTSVELTEIIRPRAEEILEMIIDKYNHSDFAKLPIRRVVLTGGGSHLIGMKDLAALKFGKYVRIGLPKNLYGLGNEYKNPIFTSVLGSLTFALNKTSHDNKSRREDKELELAGEAGYLSKMYKWLQKNF